MYSLSATFPKQYDLFLSNITNRSRNYSFFVGQLAIESNEIGLNRNKTDKQTNEKKLIQTFLYNE